MLEHIGSFPKLANGTELPFSQAVRAGDFLFLSGQLGLAEGTLVEGGIEAQTLQTLRNIEAVLALSGARMGQVIKMSVWLTDAADFAAFNAVYRQHFPQRPPVRSTVISRLALPGAKVEIEAMAYLKD